MKSKEPQAAMIEYGRASRQMLEIHSLRSQVIDFVNAVEDEAVLRECLASLSRSVRIPCSYSDTELKHEIELSMKSGVATEAEVIGMYAKWGC